MRYPAEETHRLTWESKKRRDEIHELNQTLHSLVRDLSEERENFARLNDENMQLKNIRFLNEQRLSTLNGKVEPVEQEIAFVSNSQPHTVQKYVSKHEGKQNTFKTLKDGKRE